MEFHAFNFRPQVAVGITSAGYISPTPIQVRAIPLVMEGRDVMGLAQTGTGKTAAFVLPILHRLMQGRRGCIRVLIIAPTRELAEQIHEAIGTLGRQTRLKTGDAFTFITREDEDVVSSIERVLGEKVERRTMKDFDYKKAAPAHDPEFARLQRLRNQNKPETSETHSVSVASQKRRQGRRAEGQKFGSAEVHNTSQRGSPSLSSAASTTLKYRPHNRVPSH
jgi:superfamily II DNA/RNA helicase